MPTAWRHPVPTLKGVVERPPASPKHTAHGRVFLGAGIVLLALLIGLGIWTLASRSTSASQSQTTSATPAPLGWLLVGDLPDRLRSAGYALPDRQIDYSLPVTSWLDPLTRSAAADYLRVSARSPLDPMLGLALQGTVLTGRHYPAAWNARFGTNRLTKWVERPLTGPGGQLDAFGNLTG